MKKRYGKTTKFCLESACTKENGLPEVPGQAVEVWELPGEEDAGQDERARVQGSPGGRGPPDEGGYGTHHRPNPRVVHRQPFHRRVHA